ncbi:hypothetical protein MAM1_0285c09238 [Mucor ambiguus]|uniref:Uncharacterized protein n=1 Tax=Mucor ambiguus TaxID=91626 RepID=A0A0C9MG75_9FUNG|nr:hypothetical protein MAM1_0285c09238 [Mucor ambiguus]
MKRRLGLLAIRSESSTTYYTERPESSRPTIKDRRLSDTLSQNNIIDLSNTGNASQRADIPDFEQLANDAEFEQLPNLHEKVIHCIREIFRKFQSPVCQKYKKSLPYQNQCPEDSLYLYQIISFILNEHYTNPEIFDMSLQPIELSEQDYNIIWGPLLKILFSKTSIIIKSGDTLLSDVEKRFKVDYRLGIMINHKFVDIASVEVGKKPNSSKIKEDHAKLVLESRTIIDRLINQFYFILPSSIQVVSLQVCGLKADLLKSTMKSAAEYTTERMTDRLRFPITTRNSDSMIAFLQKITLFREKVLSNANGIKDEYNEAIDQRSSFGETLSPSLKKRLPNYKSWLE